MGIPQQRIFDDFVLLLQEYEESAFASNYSIEGPLFTCSSREELKRARSLLLTVADISYVVQSLSPVEGNKLRARCSSSLWAPLFVNSIH